MDVFQRNFEAILRTYGHNIYLQRVSDPYNGDKVIYENKLEIHTVRHMKPSAQAPNVLEEQMEGWGYDVDMIYYFRKDANPTTGDRIYENVERYPNNLNTFIIDYAIPMRGVNGQLAYWAVGASREVPE